MPVQGFTYIDQYCSLTKDLENQTCDDVLGFDQEVPRSRQFPEDTVLKQEIKLEEPDFYMTLMMDNVFSNDNSNGNFVSRTNSDFQNNSSNSTCLNGSTDTFNKFATSSSSSSSLSSSSSSSSPSSFLSSSPSPMMSSATLPSTLSQFSPVSQALTMSTSDISTSNFPTSKTSTFVTELAGSGCTVVSNPDFLSDTSSSTMPSMGVPEDCLEYTDLDKQPIPFYDDYEPFSATKQEMSDESNSVPLEDAVIIMRDVIFNDCDNLNVPYDPMSWNADHVSKWVSWVCKKTGVPDVSDKLYPLDGRTLCTVPAGTFANVYGESGNSIANELELWKAANSCFPAPSSTVINGNSGLQHQQQLRNPYMESTQTFHTPCVSPAPSTCSSTHDSSSSTMSTPSDHSDDESGYGSQYSSKKLGDSRISSKLPTGRGHKQTIHLWQFLKELLLSKENHSDCIRWLDRKSGIFKIEDSKKVASLWGARKNRPAMNYDKLSRSVRQYYKKGIIKKTEQSKRLVYQFCSPYL